MDGIKDYRLTIKIRNNRLLKAIEGAGGTPGQKWCEANGLLYEQVNFFINMARSPITKKGSLTLSAAKLCDVLDKLPEDLWSTEQLYPLEKNFSEMEMDHSQVMALLPTEQQSYLMDLSDFDQEKIQSLVSQVTKQLSKKEQEVIKMRFEDDFTLDECGEKLNLSRERIRQIEAKALRKLRHPTISYTLLDISGLDDDTLAFRKISVEEYFEKERIKEKELLQKAAAEII